MIKPLFLTIAIFITTFLHAQQPLSAKQQEIQQAVVNMFQALADRDSVALKSFCSPDISLYEYGQVWNIDTLIRKAITQHEAADFKRTNSFQFLTTEADKNQAWVTYRLSSVITRDAKETNIQWLETVILERQNKEWKVKHLHSTVIKRT